jgi:hypothetical protein
VVEKLRAGWVIKEVLNEIVIRSAPACRGSAAEGSAVRSGSRTKVSVPLVPPRNRHPERSASQIDPLTQRLWRVVEGPRRCLFTHAARSFSTTEPHRAGHGVSLGPSLGKNNSKTGGAQRGSTSCARSFPSSRTSHRVGKEDYSA